ncbi:hypothetical protein GCM10012275_42060 [Longimycelium tulufanense]|uniref:Uncharacterized protein n=1 Tax=Longimycelium tulufanense TaxID=907463 RepID=A0A8J3CHE9_9PSEU|nr:hypothetical protein [Longimycelium tulufanense]GGM67139.1 hypothetical protein GCM10012275_42060 [Longimycelium tulufanense]
MTDNHPTEGNASRSNIADAAGALARLLDAIDAGEIDADEAQRAYLAGALDALRQL